MQKVLGLIGGMSWESSAHYYRMINEQVRDAQGGMHSARLLMWSFDFADIEALATSSTVATLLPAADFSTRNRYPDARRLWDAGVTVALGADCNPGTSYTTSMPFVIALAVRDLRLSPDEALWAATAGGAKALGRDDLGVLRPGAVADLALLDAPSHLHLAYRPGVPLVVAVVKNGAPARGRWT